MIKMIIFIVAYIILAPLIGGLFAGLDRKLTQGCRAESDLRYFSRFTMY